jgi:hypothetical protein
LIDVGAAIILILLINVGAAIIYYELRRTWANYLIGKDAVALLEQVILTTPYQVMTQFKWLLWPLFNWSHVSPRWIYTL